MRIEILKSAKGNEQKQNKAPAKRVQHFIQHYTTLMLYEMLHSFGHLVV